MTTNTLSINSELYATAAGNLAPGLRKNVSGAQLGTLMELLRLPPRRLVRAGLITEDQLKAFKRSANQADAAAAQEDDFDTLADDADVLKEGDETIPPAAPSGASSGVEPAPIRALLLQHGIDLPAPRVAALMHALQIAPRTFVKRGLVPESALHVPREQDLLNEVHYFRRGLKEQRGNKKREHAEMAEGEDRAHPPRGRNINNPRAAGRPGRPVAPAVGDSQPAGLPHAHGHGGGRGGGRGPHGRHGGRGRGGFDPESAELGQGMQHLHVGSEAHELPHSPQHGGPRGGMRAPPSAGERYEAAARFGGAEPHHHHHDGHHAGGPVGNGPHAHGGQHGPHGRGHAGRGGGRGGRGGGRGMQATAHFMEHEH